MARRWETGWDFYGGNVGGVGGRGTGVADMRLIGRPRFARWESPSRVETQQRHPSTITHVPLHLALVP